jgi:hypothetical protein
MQRDDRADHFFFGTGSGGTLQLHALKNEPRLLTGADKNF